MISLDNSKSSQRIQMEEYLNAAANRVETMLAGHKIQATVWGGNVGPTIIEMCLTVPVGTKFTRVEQLRDEIAATLGVQSVLLRRDKDAIIIEVPTRARLPTLTQVWQSRNWKQQDGVLAFLGLNNEGKPVLARLDADITPHVMIAGMTGSGKTTELDAIIWWLTHTYSPATVSVAILDPKGIHYRKHETVHHLIGEIANGTDICIDAVGQLATLMDTRYGQRISRPHIVIVIDELADLVLQGGSATIADLTRLAQKGREAGMSLVVATQKPMALTVPGLIKFNMPLRLVGSVTCPEDAKAASGLAGTGAEHLPGRGAFLQVLAGSKVTRIQGLPVNET